VNKTQLIDEVHRILGPSVPRATAEKALQSVLDALENGVVNDGAVQIVGFGTFTVKARPARTGRNPRTGEPVEIKASRNVNFKAGTSLKKRLEG
jgi:DNA-binding protein HU-beta